MTIKSCMVPTVPEIRSVAELFDILGHFSPFYLTINNTQNQNFQKMKKKPRDIIILHMCTINDNHIMYGSWDMECLREIFLSFWTIFW